MAKQTMKPMPEKASLDMLEMTKDVTPRGEGKVDMQSNGVWRFADQDLVEGNLEGKYEDGSS